MRKDNYFFLPTQGLGGGTTRLLAHSVSDGSSRLWIPTLVECLDSLKKKGVDFSTPEELDRRLAEHLDYS